MGLLISASAAPHCGSLYRWNPAAVPRLKRSGKKNSWQYTMPKKVVLLQAVYSHTRIWAESRIHSLPAVFFFFFRVEVSSRTPVPLFRPGSVHSSSASWDDCGREFSDKLRVRSFSWLCLDSIVSQFRLRWVKGVGVFRCNLPLALLAKWPGVFLRATAVTQGRILRRSLAEGLNSWRSNKVYKGTVKRHRQHVIWKQRVLTGIDTESAN